MGETKRLLGVGALLLIVIAALSSHDKSGTTTTSAANEPAIAAPVTTTPHRAAHVTYTRCDENISAGPHTSCGFADNVFRAFARELSGEESDPVDNTISAGSPTTGHTYSMSCKTSAATTVCTGGHDARVRFPLSAAEVYYRPSTPAAGSTPSYEDEYEEPPEEGGSAPESESPAESGECTNGTYENSAGNTVCRPEEAPSAPAGAKAECADGTYSLSESRSGTCSHHGGVRSWL